MKHTLITFLLIYIDMPVNGQSNITSFLRSFDRNLPQKDGCSESVNNCTRLDTILPNSTCFDVHLNYEYTYENTNFNLNLDNWVVIQAIPQCWNYLKKLLCSIKYPECTQTNSNWIVRKPVMAICLVTKKECPLLISNKRDDNISLSVNQHDSDIYSLVDQTPSFLECDQYSSNCLIDTYKRMHPMIEQVYCKWPTVKTSEPSLWIKGISKCSFYCQTPYFSKDEYQQTKSIFSVLGITFFFLNLFVLWTLILHQIQHSKYHWHPLLLNLFIIHLYMLLSTFGWMMPLLPGIGNSIVCRDDEALQIRKPEVKVGEALWCVVAFSLVYFPLIAGSITSISFFYSVLNVVKNYANCCLNKDNRMEKYSSKRKSSKLPFLSRKLGFTSRKSDDKVKKKNHNIELKERKPKEVEDTEVRFKGKGLSGEYSVSRGQSLSAQVYVLLISVTLLVISLTIAEIRADPVSGICFISTKYMTTRICLSLLPLTVFLVIKTVIIYCVIRHLRTIQRYLTVYVSCQQEIHSKRISRTTKFYAFILLFLWTFWGFSVYSHWYIFVHEKSWYRGLTNNFLCQLKQSLLSSLSIFSSNIDSSTSCPLETKPIMNVFILHNLSYFSIHIVYIICTIFNKHSILVWKYQFLRRCSFQTEVDESTQEIVESKNMYLGLQNRSLLDGLWNPGVFVYLVKKKKKNLNHENCKSGIEEKSATIGSGEGSSASYCIYQQDGSLRSCVSMPPINGMFRHNATSFSQEISKDSHIGTTLDNFLKVTQGFIDQNSVRRSNSFAGRPCLNSNSCMGTSNIVHANYRHGNLEDPTKSLLNNRVCDHSRRHLYDGHSHCCITDHIASQTNCLSLNRLSYLRNTQNISKKSTRRFSMFVDRRKDNGISSRSTLNRRKRLTRYSISPRSLSKAIHQRSSISSHRADPASCHSSSFSAESYNSYNLMAQQMGGRWRDICRTRMTLHDAMLWARSATLSHLQNPICPHIDLCQHHQQCCVTPSLSGHNYHYRTATNNEYNTLIDQNIPLSNDPPTGHCEAHKDNSYFRDSQNLTLPPKSDSSNCDNNSQVKVNDNDSSDQFNSEDEVESNGSNSVKSSGKESGEFCSEDEIVSLVNSDN